MTDNQNGFWQEKPPPPPSPPAPPVSPPAYAPPPEPSYAAPPPPVYAPTAPPAYAPPPPPSYAAPPPPVYAPQPPLVAAPAGPRGVGGWLLLFCVSLTFLNPAMTAYNVFQTDEATRSVLARYPALNTLTQIDAVVGIIIAGLSIYAGIAMWRVRPGAVRAARIFLIVGLIYAVIAPFTPLFADLPQRANDAIMSAAFSSAGRGAIYYFIWLSYLSSSRRVRTTYANIAAPVYQPPVPM